MNLHTNIKNLRKSQGWTQTELAKKLGTTQKVIHDYESGKTKPPLERLPEIADLFQISVDELLGVTELKIEKEKKHVHRSSRLSKIQEEFAQLTSSEQTHIRKQINGLITQREKRKS